MREEQECRVRIYALRVANARRPRLPPQRPGRRKIQKEQRFAWQREEVQRKMRTQASAGDGIWENAQGRKVSPRPELPRLLRVVPSIPPHRRRRGENGAAPSRQNRASARYAVPLQVYAHARSFIAAERRQAGSNPSA
jgi:hypothetical protein